MLVVSFASIIKRYKRFCKKSIPLVVLKSTGILSLFAFLYSTIRWKIAGMSYTCTQNFELRVMKQKVALKYLEKYVIFFHKYSVFIRILIFLCVRSISNVKPIHPLLSTAISGVSSGCQQGGCLTCSDYNGCLSCKPRFFMHLERIGMKQIGVCMTSCPPGFYGTRSPERNTCTSESNKLQI